MPCYQEAFRLIGEADQIRTTTLLSIWFRQSTEAELMRMWVHLQYADPDFPPGHPLTDHSKRCVLSWRNKLIDSEGNLSSFPNVMVMTEALTLARAEIAAHQTQNALRWLEQVTQCVRAAGYVNALIYSLVITAVARQDQSGNQSSEIHPQPQALAALEEALRLAEPGSYVRIFLNEGEPIKALLSHWV